MELSCLDLIFLMLSTKSNTIPKLMFSIFDESWTDLSASYFVVFYTLKKKKKLEKVQVNKQRKEEWKKTEEEGGEVFL